MPTLTPRVRIDLKYQADPAEEGKHFVKDPIRGEFFRYNELQVAMMRALDGKRTIAEVQQHLADAFDAEVPAAAIDRFVDRLERAYLLDVTSYRIDDDKTRKAIRASLAKRGLALRIKARNSLSPEGALFEAATRQLHDGDPCMAASYLEAVIEVNPENESARAVLRCIQEAFFKTKIVIPSHVKMFHLWSPDRFLAAFDRRFGRFLFSRFGVIVMALFIVSGAFAAADVLHRPALFSKLGLSDIPAVLFVFALLHVLLHELSHGLACKHYGGTVDSLGLLLMYGTLPGGYCDVSESYLFSNRRHKMVVQIAGVFGHMVVQAAVWHVLDLTDASMPLWTALLACNLFVVYSNLKNWIPFAKFDGYYALAEYLRLANLRERSFTYLRERLSVIALGAKATIVVSPRERRIFLLYGVLACAFTSMLLYFMFISFLLPLAVETFGTAGLVLSILYIAQQIIWPIVRAVVRVTTLAVRDRARVFTRRRTTAFAVIAVALGSLLLLVPWPFHVEGQVDVEPRARSFLRAAEPGLVEEVRVHEGDRVEAGQVVAVLRGDDLARDRAILVEELAAAQARLSAMERGARREELALARTAVEVDTARFGVATTQLRDARRRQSIGAQSAASVAMTSARASSAGGDVVASVQDQALVRAGTRTEDVAVQRASVRRLASQLQGIDLRVERLSVRTPISGIVVTRRPEEQHGRWLNIGDQVLEVHDVSAWRLRIVPDPGEPLDELVRGQEVEVSAAGLPGKSMTVRVDEIAPPESNDTRLVVYASGAHPAWRSGMRGVAQIHVPSRSLGYRVIALPLIRIFDFDLWRVR
jgi:putative peptide zinc metalloprotease protein